MNWEKKRVLVTVKAYPEKSKKYGPVVCTVGLTEEGEWIRLYPITLDAFSGNNKLKKYDWIEVECKKAEEKLSRKESYKIRNGSLKIIDRNLSTGKVKGKVNWNERNKLILKHVSPSLEYLRDKFKEDRTSIGLIKPVDLIDFYTKGELRIYIDKKEFQQALFGPSMPVVEDIPHLFSYRFRCAGCAEKKEHNIQCEDWELFESYRSWGKKYKDINVLWEKLYQRYYRDMLKEDLYFYMGTFSQYPTWLIIGLYYPPVDVEIRQKSGVNLTLGDFLKDE